MPLLESNFDISWSYYPQTIQEEASNNWCEKSWKNAKNQEKNFFSENNKAVKLFIS